MLSNLPFATFQDSSGFFHSIRRTKSQLAPTHCVRVGYVVVGGCTMGLCKYKYVSNNESNIQNVLLIKLFTMDSEYNNSDIVTSHWSGVASDDDPILRLPGLPPPSPHSLSGGHHHHRDTF